MVPFGSKALWGFGFLAVVAAVAYGAATSDNTGGAVLAFVATGAPAPRRRGRAGRPRSGAVVRAGHPARRRNTQSAAGRRSRAPWPIVGCRRRGDAGRRRRHQRRRRRRRRGPAGRRPARVDVAAVERALDLHQPLRRPPEGAPPAAGRAPRRRGLPRRRSWSISLSRIFLALPENGTRAVALAVALVVLLSAFAVAASERMARTALTLLIVFAFASVIGAGVAGLAHGERKFEKPTKPVPTPRSRPASTRPSPQPPRRPEERATPVRSDPRHARSPAAPGATGTPAPPPVGRGGGRRRRGRGGGRRRADLIGGPGRQAAVRHRPVVHPGPGGGRRAVRHPGVRAGPAGGPDLLRRVVRALRERAAADRAPLGELAAPRTGHAPGSSGSTSSISARTGPTSSAGRGSRSPPASTTTAGWVAAGRSTGSRSRCSSPPTGTSSPTTGGSCRRPGSTLSSAASRRPVDDRRRGSALRGPMTWHGGLPRDKLQPVVPRLRRLVRSNVP